MPEHLNENFEFEDNIDLGINYMELITNSIFKLTQSINYKENIPYHMREFESKYFRFGLANQSILRLVKGNQFKLIDEEVLIPDIFSLKSLTRMQIESYLIMYYIFSDNVSDEEKAFRYDIYKIHALQKQLGFEIDNEIPFIKAQKLKIQNELNEVLESMKNSSFYRIATDKEKNKYLSPRHPKLIDSKELLDLSGLTKLGINQLWQLYSNYAHSEYISDRQYNSIITNKTSLIKDCSLIITIILVLTSRLIVEILNKFEFTKIEFNNFGDKEKTLIEKWYNFKR